MLSAAEQLTKMMESDIPPDNSALELLERMAAQISPVDDLDNSPGSRENEPHQPQNVLTVKEIVRDDLINTIGEPGVFRPGESRGFEVANALLDFGRDAEERLRERRKNRQNMTSQAYKDDGTASENDPHLLTPEQKKQKALSGLKILYDESKRSGDFSDETVKIFHGKLSNGDISAEDIKLNFPEVFNKIKNNTIDALNILANTEQSDGELRGYDNDLVKKYALNNLQSGILDWQDLPQGLIDAISDDPNFAAYKPVEEDDVEPVGNGEADDPDSQSGLSIKDKIKNKNIELASRVVHSDFMKRAGKVFNKLLGLVGPGNEKYGLKESPKVISHLLGVGTGMTLAVKTASMLTVGLSSGGIVPLTLGALGLGSLGSMAVFRYINKKRYIQSSENFLEKISVELDQIRATGVEPSQKQIKELAKKYDADHNGFFRHWAHKGYYKLAPNILAGTKGILEGATGMTIGMALSFIWQHFHGTPVPQSSFHNGVDQAGGGQGRSWFDLNKPPSYVQNQPTSPIVGGQGRGWIDPNQQQPNYVIHNSGIPSQQDVTPPLQIGADDMAPHVPQSVDTTLVSEVTKHMVEKGDTVWGIAEKMLTQQFGVESPDKAMVNGLTLLVSKLSGLPNPDVIFPGYVLKFPNQLTSENMKIVREIGRLGGNNPDAVRMLNSLVATLK